MSRDPVAPHSFERPLMPGEVRGYLMENPEFLADNSDLFAFIMPPHKQHGDKVRDFQQYMLLRLQDHYNAIKDEHEELTQLMQEHLQRQCRFNDASLALMDAESLKAMLEYVEKGLAIDLDQEAAALVMESGGLFEEGVFAGLRVAPDGFVNNWLGGCDIELAEQSEPAPDLFGEKASAVRSRALLRLDVFPGLPPGLLALGHRDPMYYSSGLATEQVEFLGAVIERCFRKWMNAA